MIKTTFDFLDIFCSITFLLENFQDAQKSFNDWFDHFHQKKPQEPKKPPTGCSFPEQIAYDHAILLYNGEYDRWKATLDLLTKVLFYYCLIIQTIDY